MIMIRKYSRSRDDKGRIKILSYEINLCPVCGESLFVIGTRERKYNEDDGTKVILIIRRLRCKSCRVIHHELPDILIPYKRHCAATVEKIVNGDKNVCCDDGVITRIKKWWASCELYFEGVLTSLREKYGDVFSQYPAPREIVRAVVNANLWVHTHSA
jgi:hypothetical protein